MFVNNWPPLNWVPMKVSRINAMVVRLREVKTYTDDGQIKFIILRGLPETYESVIVMIDTQKHLSIDDTVAILRRHQQKEKERKIGAAEKEKAMAAYSKTNGNYNKSHNNNNGGSGAGRK